jgi:hypothetical protein
MRLSLLLASLAAIALATAESASAGQYVIRNCNVPGDHTRPIGPWRWIASAGTFGYDNCGVGEGFGIAAGTMPEGSAGQVVVETGVDSGIVLRRVRVWLVARLSDTGSTMYLAASSGNASFATPAEGIFQTPGGNTLSTPYVSPLFADNTVVFLLLVSCSIDAGACTPSATNILEIRGAEATLEENIAPTGSVDGGELMSAGAQAGVRALEYTVRDPQSGVARIAITVGKTVVGTADFASECAYADLAACPPSKSGSIAVDTRKVPDGLYPVSLRVTDAAGNEQTVQSPTAIQVANGAAGAPSGSGAATNARVIASFAANRHATLTVGYGRRAVVRGRVVGAGGERLGGISLNAEERPAAGGTGARQGTLTTKADGTFTYTLRRGTSRTLLFSYQNVVKRLKLRVKASATLRVGLSGILVRYRGRVLSKPLPRKGKLVEIQGRAPGAGWKTFARRRTTRTGNYSGTYRLRVHRPGVRLQFRVLVPSETKYPFVAHAGAAVKRIVR